MKIESEDLPNAGVLIALAVDTEKRIFKRKGKYNISDKDEWIGGDAVEWKKDKAKRPWQVKERNDAFGEMMAKCKEVGGFYKIKITDPITGDVKEAKTSGAGACAAAIQGMSIEVVETITPARPVKKKGVAVPRISLEDFMKKKLPAILKAPKAPAKK